MKQRGRVISQQRKAMQRCPQIKTNQSASSKHTHTHTHTQRESECVCVCGICIRVCSAQFSLACVWCFLFKKEETIKESCTMFCPLLFLEVFIFLFVMYVVCEVQSRETRDIFD